jgi:hypothetical protein
MIARIIASTDKTNDNTKQGLEKINGKDNIC